MVTLMSYDGICCIALTINAAAVPDDEQLVGCVEQGLAEVTALARSSGCARALRFAGGA
jgi:hypothetical protein